MVRTALTTSSSATVAPSMKNAKAQNSTPPLITQSKAKAALAEASPAQLTGLLASLRSTLLVRLGWWLIFDTATPTCWCDLMVECWPRIFDKEQASLHQRGTSLVTRPSEFSLLRQTGRSQLFFFLFLIHYQWCLLSDVNGWLIYRWKDSASSSFADRKGPPFTFPGLKTDVGGISLTS